VKTKRRLSLNRKKSQKTAKGSLTFPPVKRKNEKELEGKKDPWPFNGIGRTVGQKELGIMGSPSITRRIERGYENFRGRLREGASVTRMEEKATSEGTSAL